MDLSDYVTSGTWDIIDCPGVYNVTYNPVEHHHVARIVFKLVIRRRTLFYTVNLIIPCILISLISVCVFYLPADAGEKMTMCISILLALVVFMLLVSKILPPTSLTIPLIAKYLLFTFIMNILTILITVIIINWNFRTPRTHRMANWIRVIFLRWLPRILLMRRPNFAQRFANKPHYSLTNSAVPSRRTSTTVLRNSRSNDATPTDSRGRRDRDREEDGCSDASVLTKRTTSYIEMADMRRNHIESRARNHGNAANCISPSSRTSPACAYNRTTPLTGGGDATPSVGDGGWGRDRGGSGGGGESAFHMTPEIHKAVEAVRFIAAHLKNEDDYIMVGAV